MPRRPRKRPPLAIQRINKLIPRLEFAIALEHMAGDNVDMRDLAKLLRATDPDTARQTISTLAQKIGIPYDKVIDCYQKSKRLESIVQVAQHLPTIAEGIAIDAESKETTCTTCEGSGVIVVKAQVGKEGDANYSPAETKTCIPCEGVGSVLHSGDPVARKQVLEMMNLAGSQAMPIVAPGSQFLFTGASLEDTLRAGRKGNTNGSDRNERGPEGNQQEARTLDAGSGDDRSATVGDQNGPLRREG